MLPSPPPRLAKPPGRPRRPPGTAACRWAFNMIQASTTPAATNSAQTIGLKFPISVPPPSHAARQPCPEPREFGHLRLVLGLRVTRRLEVRGGGRAPQQP